MDEKKHYNNAEEKASSKEITRRDFLKNAAKGAVAGVTALAVPNLVSVHADPIIYPEDEIRFPPVNRAAAFMEPGALARTSFYDSEIVRLLDAERCHRHVWYMSEVIGPRLWGTREELACANWCAGVFRSYGITNVRVDELPRNINGTGANQTHGSLVIHNFNDPVAAQYGHPTTFNKGIPVARGATDNTLTRTGANGITGIAVTAANFGQNPGDFPAQTSGNISVIAIDDTVLAIRGTGADQRTDPVRDIPGVAGHGFTAAVNQNARRDATLGAMRTAYANAVAAGATTVLFIAPEPLPHPVSTPAPNAAPGQGVGNSVGWAQIGTGVAPWANYALENPNDPTNVPYAFVPDFAAEMWLLKNANTTVTYTMTSNDRFWNTVAVIPPSIPNPNAEIIIFIAHLDTVTSAPGANDNASGVAALMELARVYQTLQRQDRLVKEVIFVAVGCEEAGLVGAHAIARPRPGTGFNQAQVDRIIGCYNMDMIAPADWSDAGMTINLRQQRLGQTGTGNHPPTPDTVNLSTIPAAERLGFTDLGLYARNPFQNAHVPSNPLPTSIREQLRFIKLTQGGGSDHVPFGEVGIPNANHTYRIAVTIPPSPYNHVASLERMYHTPADIFEWNYCKTRMELILEVVAASSYALARVYEETMGEVIWTYLDAVLTEAAGLNQEHYYPIGWGRMTSAYNIARATRNDASSTQSRVNEVTLRLRAAIDELVLIIIEMPDPIDWEDLDYTLAQRAGLVQADYTPISWARMISAYNIARSVRDQTDPYPTQDRVWEVAERLYEAIGNLVRVTPIIPDPADFDELDEALALREGLVQANFTPISWARMISAYNIARSVRNDLNATQSRVDEVTERLTEAIGNLAPLSTTEQHEEPPAEADTTTPDTDTYTSAETEYETEDEAEY